MGKSKEPAAEGQPKARAKGRTSVAAKTKKLESARLRALWERYQKRPKKSMQPTTQEEVSINHLGRSPGFFSQLLNGQTPIPTQTLLTLAILLDFDPREVRPEVQTLIDQVFKAVQRDDELLIAGYAARLSPDQLKQVIKFCQFLLVDQSERE